MPGISKGQIKLIWTAADRLELKGDGGKDSELYDIVESVTGRRSISQMSRSETREVMKILKKMGVDWINTGTDGPKKKDRCGNVIELMSRRQRWKIYDLARELGWVKGAGLDVRVNGFCQRIVKKGFRYLQKKDAGKVINGLQTRLFQEKYSESREGV